VLLLPSREYDGGTVSEGGGLMTHARAACAALLLGAGTASAIACSKPAPQPTPPAQQAQAAAPTQAAPLTQPPATIAPAPPGSGVIASAQFSSNPQIRCDLLEVKRVSGNALLVRWRVVHVGATRNIQCCLTDWNGLNYIDPAENKKYSFLTDSEGTRIVDVKGGLMDPGEQWISWAKFPAPPPTSNKISLSISGFAPFEDVPVQ